ncbi:hypothetical protein DPEC_G00347430 [Dallia pectoralis]|uniref:Uncharacterized protein n=1 Tax=Dallia pectoralis TaxID=75939 RepID=A0ACC2F409_DALPE|nr:hypothetical protein DPEC_G00347430 [Dallia pectoralis]
MACVLKPTEMIRVRSATDCRSDSGDPGYSSETQWSAEMQKLLVEFRTLYHERLRQIDQSDDCREETLQSKVGVLQSFVRELSEQNEVLIQALEAEKVEGSAVEGRAASMQKELEELKLNMREEKLPELQSNAFRKRRPALALCPMPVDFVGTNETVFLRTAQVIGRLAASAAGKQQCPC